MRERISALNLIKQGIIGSSCLVLGLALTGCKNEGVAEGGSVAVAQPGTPTVYSKFDINAYPSNKVVCDPWGGENPPSIENGVKATLFYKTTQQPRYYNVIDMITRTRMSEQTLFFTDLNVPTRLFQNGFATQTSEVVKDDSGQKLVEFFGLKFNTDIVLGPNDTEGLYEFAILSDDGSRMKANGQEIIVNDGDHPTRMGCSTTTFNMTRSSRIPVEILYYQGPRYHISHVLMWRKTTVAQAGHDSQCGQMGNNYFFDPDHGSIPMAPYNGLIARGWRPLVKENFVIPGSGTEGENVIQAAYNACFEGQIPEITNLRAADITPFEASILWNTQILASSQVLVIEPNTGVTQLTESDNILRTSHNVRLTGLLPGIQYRVQAVSVSADLGRTISSPISLTTLAPAP